ncbi:MAG: Xaa-Pro dipeptidase [Thermomicrobiales bacterium]|nr:Xaa-Pro dipeptidase [Thermomicrobiales bacterium]
MLTQEGCRTRQERFRALLAREGIDAAVISDPRDVYYLTGFLASGPMPLPVLLYLESDGRSVLAAPNADDPAAVDERATYEPHLLATLNPDPMRRLGRAIADHLAGARSVRRLGWQAESLPRHVGDLLATTLHPEEWTPIDDGLADLQKRKDPDEIALLRESIACTLAAYDAVREAIAPGANELAVLEAGHRAANLRAGEPVFHNGDYRSGEPGGPARNREIEAGELYIVDAWTIYRGYWSDLCRTFPVAEPTPLQREVFAHMAQILSDVPSQLKPGAHGTDLWRWIDRRIREHPHLREAGLGHHAGHGVGVRAHEAPDLNRDREGILEPGNVVSCEPGSYVPDLNSGVRLENTFLITETGCELLSNYPVVLTT